MTELISLETSADSALAQAAKLLRQGSVVALPTDTVYGLAALANKDRAIAKLFDLKQRPDSMPIAVLVSDVAQVLAMTTEPSEPAQLLMQKFWPGPLTIVLPARSGLANAGGGLPKGAGDGLPGVAGGETVGVRCPDHNWVRKLAADVGPLSATSANLHGGAPCATASEVAAMFAGHAESDDQDGIALIVDGGKLDAPASTVVSWEGEQLVVLREGSITDAQLQAALG